MVTPVHQKLTVVAHCLKAEVDGVLAGMSLAEARAMCNDLQSVDHDPEADSRAREALARWMTRFTPEVTLSWPTLPMRALKLPPQPDLLFLNLTGCERVFHGLKPLVRKIMAALNRLKIPARMALASTPGAAWAAAFGSGKRFAFIEESNLIDMVSPLPVATLRLQTETVEALNHLGLSSVGQVLNLPRETLPSRFGPLLPIRLAQLLGERIEPLVGLAYEPPIQAQVSFDEPVESLETLWLVLKELIGRIVPQLERRGRGARKIEFICKPDTYCGMPPVSRIIHLSRPNRNPKNLFDLLRCATEQLDCGDGFVRVALKVLVHEPVTQQQIHLLGGEEHEHAAELDGLLERLRVRLGDDAVVVPVRTPSRLPERAWCGMMPGEAAPMCDAPPVPVRPLCLLPTPLEIPVIVEPSDYWDGNPAQFTYQRQIHRLAHVSGPERISGEWWQDHHKTRDYYDVSDEQGRRFWIFRVVRLIHDERVSVRWFLHGFFH